MQVLAKARFVRTSPRKARLVADAIRGKDAQEALGILKFTPNFAAKLIEKVLKSAIANAENNYHMDGDRLKVSTIMIDGGPIMKRVRYAPMGRGYRMLKRLSHITVMVEEGEVKPKKHKEVARTVKGRKAAAKPAAETPAKVADETTAEKPARKRSKKVEAAAPVVEETPAAEPEAVETVEEPQVEAVPEEAPVTDSVQAEEQAGEQVDEQAEADGADGEKPETEGGN